MCSVQRVPLPSPFSTQAALDPKCVHITMSMSPSPSTSPMLVSGESSNPVAVRRVSHCVPLPSTFRYHHWLPTTMSLCPSPSMSPMDPPWVWVFVNDPPSGQGCVGSAPGMRHCGRYAFQTHSTSGLPSPLTSPTATSSAPPVTPVKNRCHSLVR